MLPKSWVDKRKDHLQQMGSLQNLTIQNCYFDGSPMPISISHPHHPMEDMLFHAKENRNTLVDSYDWSPYRHPEFLLNDHDPLSFSFNEQAGYISIPGGRWYSEQASSILQILRRLEDSQPGTLFLSPKLIWLHCFEFTQDLQVVLKATLEPYPGWNVMDYNGRHWRNIIMLELEGMQHGFKPEHAEIAITLVNYVKEFLWTQNARL